MREDEIVTFPEVEEKGLIYDSDERGNALLEGFLQKAVTGMFQEGLQVRKDEMRLSLKNHFEV